MKKFNLLGLIILLCIGLYAQWSGDSSMNLMIDDETGEQAIPKVAVNQIGMTYISWFSSASGNYDVKLQRLDSTGYAIWNEGGIVVSAHEQMSWLTDWDMKMDNDNHAILTFQDIRNNENNNVYAYRVSPSGDFIWGGDGLELSNSTAFDVSPKIGITDQNNAIISWQADDVIRIQKISPTGELLFGDDGIVLEEAGITYSWPQIIPMSDDTFILKYFKDTGQPWAPTRHIYAQKFDENGNPLWTSETAITTAGGISAWTQVMPIVKDNNDGFYIAWHEDRDQDNLSEVYLQHIESDSNVFFQENGIEICLNTVQNHFYPKLTYFPEDDILIAAWSEMDGNQNQRGISAQKINATGDLLWGDNALTIVPLSNNDVQITDIQKSENDFAIFYSTNLGGVNINLHATGCDLDGNFVWNEPQLLVSDAVGEKLHKVVSPLQFNQWIYVWVDRRSGSSDIYAQNITLNGTLGDPLPVTLDYFTGEVAGDDIDIFWQTSFETDLVGFQVYRADSNDIYEAIDISGLIDANNLPGPTEYEFIDFYDFVNGQTYYYWLQVIALDGTTEFFGHIDIFFYDDSQPVILTYFYAEVDESDINVLWQTQSEQANSGWNLYRADNGDFLESEKVNDELIEGAGTTTEPTDYEFTDLTDLIYGQIYYYWLESVDYGGSTILFGPTSIIFDGTEVTSENISAFNSLGNYPNPFNPSTTISFKISSRVLENPTRDFKNAKINIYNLKGQQVRELRITNYELRNNGVVWDGTDNKGKTMPSGVYFYQLQVGNRKIITKKCLMMK